MCWGEISDSSHLLAVARIYLHYFAKQNRNLLTKYAYLFNKSTHSLHETQNDKYTQILHFISLKHDEHLLQTIFKSSAKNVVNIIISHKT